MTGTSLKTMSAAGQNLRPVQTKEISYPAEDFQVLAQLEPDHFWFVSRRRQILKLIRKFCKPVGGPVSGLDIGCGTGFTSVWLTEKGLPTWGVDGHEGFKHYQDAKRGAGFLSGDIFSIEPLPEFDFILLLDVLEHIADDRAFFLQALRFLRPGGIAVITVPALQSLWSRNDEIAGHYRRYDKKSMTRLFRDTGSVEVKKLHYFFGTTLPLYWLSQKSNMKREAKPSAFVNQTLKGVLFLESQLTAIGGLPLGSSLFACVAKLNV